MIHILLIEQTAEALDDSSLACFISILRGEKCEPED